MATSCHRGHLLLVTVGQGSSLPAAGRPSQAFSHGLPLHITFLGDILMSVGDDTRPSPGRGSRDTLGTDQQGTPRRCHQDNFGTHEHPLGDTTPAPPGHFLSGGPRYPPKALRSLFPKQELTPRAAAHPQPAAEPQSHQGSVPLAYPHPSAQLQQTESVPVRNSSPDLQPGAVTKSVTPTSLTGKAAWCWPPSRPKQGELLNLSRGFGRAAVRKAVSPHARCNADRGQSPSVARV